MIRWSYARNLVSIFSCDIQIKPNYFKKRLTNRWCGQPSRFKLYCMVHPIAANWNQSMYLIWNGNMKFDGFVKSPIRLRRINICVTLHPSSLRSTVSTPHSSGFACLDLELFTKPSGIWLFTSSSNLIPSFFFAQLYSIRIFLYAFPFSCKLGTGCNCQWTDMKGVFEKLTNKIFDIKKFSKSDYENTLAFTPIELAIDSSRPGSGRGYSNISLPHWQRICANTGASIFV